MKIQQWSFPAGERGVRVELNQAKKVLIKFNFNGSDSLIDLLLTVDAIRGTNSSIDIELECNYFPYARQDRRASEGESHSMRVISNLFNSLCFTSITICDAHSDVVEALVNNCKILTQDTVISSVVDVTSYDYLIAPDVGAVKKIYKTATKYNKSVIVASKVRDTLTGSLSGFSVNKEDYINMKGKKLLVVDDICDGGGTFIGLRGVLPENCIVDLYTTHGIYSKGKQILLERYENLYCYNDMSQISDTISISATT